MERRILLVDDDPRFRSAVVLSCSDSECRITQATTLKEAEWELKLSSFDLLIVDGVLPDGDGLTWIASLRERKINTPAVFISAHYHDSTSFKTLIYDLDCCRVLHKPVSVKVLGEEIRRALEISSKDDDSDISDDLAFLEEQYKKDLPARMEKIQAGLKKVMEQSNDIVVLRDVINQTHLLRGTAGMYGLPEFGRDMGRIEDMLSILMKAIMNGSNYPESFASIQKAITDAARAVLTPRTSYKKAPSPERTEATSSRHRQVLILGKDAAFNQRLEALLCSERYVTFAFSDNVFIDEMLEQIRPDLVLVDLNIEENSLEFCKKLSAHEIMKDIEIVAIVDQNDRGLPDRARESKVSACIFKQMSNLDMLGTIQNHIRTGGAMVVSGTNSLRVA